MAVLNDFVDNLKTKVRLKATAVVLQKLDTEKIADYLVDYGDKFYKRGRHDFVECIYMKLLELVSAVNRRRTK